MIKKITILLAMFSVCGCSLMRARSQNAQANPPTPSQTEKAEAPKEKAEPAAEQKPADEKKSEVKAEESKPADAKSAVNTDDVNIKMNKADAFIPPVVPGVIPEQSMKWLRNGNTRFVKGFFRKDGADQKDVKRLAESEHPHAVVLSCSDSRVPPEVVFDQKLGEIFTVRNLGETLDTATVASMEYAISHLGTRLIVVMGHTNCGAVKAAMNTLDGQDSGTANMNQLVTSIHPRLQGFHNSKASDGYRAEGWAEAKGVAADVLKYSALIREKVSKGDVKIVSALYDVETGKVEWSE